MEPRGHEGWHTDGCLSWEDPKPWRVGRKLGKTLYVGDECVGMVDTSERAK
jgi:hypothetical protein